MVSREGGLRTSRRISHCFVMDVPGHDEPLIITDAAINIAPTLEEKVHIVQNAIDLARILGYEEPKVAILSAVETVNPKIQSTLDAAALCKMADRGQIKGGILDGPLAFDNAISAEEIDARIRQWRESKVGLMQVACHVQLDGMPLANAKVVFDPEPFLGSVLKQATGQTTQDGTAVMSLAKEHLPNPSGTGVACGWYKIRVTCDQKQIPARYNSDTTLGCEVAIDAVWASEGVVKVSLTSN